MVMVGCYIKGKAVSKNTSQRNNNPLYGHVLILILKSLAVLANSKCKVISKVICKVIGKEPNGSAHFPVKATLHRVIQLRTVASCLHP